MSVENLSVAELLNEIEQKVVSACDPNLTRKALLIYLAEIGGAVIEVRIALENGETL